MKNILIFRYVSFEGPGYLSQYLQRRDFSYRLVKIDRSDTVPNSIDGVRGLAFMGGPMSVHDDLPWIKPILQLIQQAHARSIPILGHCLGAQLIAKALGGSIHRNPVKEIGWLPVHCLAPFPRLSREFQAFHWHSENFTIPAGAQHLFASDACPHQGFKIGNTMALQFHVEMLADMVRIWTEEYSDEITLTTKTIQNRILLMQDLDNRISQLHQIAEAIYDVWISSLN